VHRVRAGRRGRVRDPVHLVRAAGGVAGRPGVRRVPRGAAGRVRVRRGGAGGRPGGVAGGLGARRARAARPGDPGEDGGGPRRRAGPAGGHGGPGMRIERERRRARIPPAADGVGAVAGDEPVRHDIRLRDGFLHCLKVFLAMRVILSLIALFAVAVLPNLAVLKGPAGYALPGPVDVPGWPAHAITPGWHNLVTAWERFDALWYLKIAAHGYANHDGSAAFFPLYPLVIRWVSWALGGHPLAAALLVSNAAFLAALVMLYALTARETSVEVARRATVYLAAFPTAFFFLAPYSESL